MNIIMNYALYNIRKTQQIIRLSFQQIEGGTELLPTRTIHAGRGMMLSAENRVVIGLIPAGSISAVMGKGVTVAAMKITAKA